ncbi:MAG: class II aldolase/adducin family protein [Oscillochloris sp.]|nr:class II aldolase/adducin family protein [Oscillochloris sp.]
MEYEQQLRHEIVAIGRRLYERGLVVAGDGNISARLPDDTILITPAGLCKADLTIDDPVVVDLDGRLLRAVNGRRPSSEQQLHLAVYRNRPDVLACVHAHPPTATAATLAGVSMTEPLLPEALLALGPVPTAPYARTGTVALGEAVTPLLPGSCAVLLSHHGAITFGWNLTTAFASMEQLEHCARILLSAHLFGGARPLPAAQIEEIAALRRQIVAAQEKEYEALAGEDRGSVR